MGQVILLEEYDDMYVFGCEAIADPVIGLEWYFPLPSLDATTVDGPDFSESDHCPNGCAWEWDHHGDTLVGIRVWLPETAQGNGRVCNLSGWPIIDNLDLKMRPLSVGKPMLQVVPEGLLLSMPGRLIPGLEWRIYALDGQLVWQGLGDGSPVSVPLPSGIYEVQATWPQGRWSQKVLLP